MNVFDSIFIDINLYSKKDKFKLIEIFSKHHLKYDFIDHQIQQIISSLDVQKICESLKICLSIDLNYTRDRLQEENKENSNLFYQYLLIYSILEVYQTISEKGNLMDWIIKSTESKVPERKDSLV
jgi:hypothetical protein